MRASQTIFFHYEEIDALRMRAGTPRLLRGLLRRTIYRFTVHTLAGETFTISNLYVRVAQLGEQLNQRVDRVLIPASSANSPRAKPSPSASRSA